MAVVQDVIGTGADKLEDFFKFSVRSPNDPPMSVSAAVTLEPARPGKPDRRGNAGPAACGAVLLVEDETTLADLLKRIFARCSRRVIHARDTAECQRLLDEHGAGFALAFAACGLPDDHGSAFGQKLRVTMPGLPELVNSGREQPSLAALLATDGLTAFLPDNFSPPG